MLSLLLLALLAAPFALASNAGIFNDDGSVIQVATPNITYVPPVQARHTKRETNGMRLRRGLPLLAPTRRSSAVRPRTSPTPCSPLSNAVGTIQVTNVTSGLVIGFMSSVFDGQNSYTFSTTTPLTVSLPSLSPFDTVFDITAVDGPDAAHPLVGSVGGSGGYTFGAGQHGYTYLSGTGHTDANSPPSSTAGTSIQTLGYNGPSESQIWSIDCNTLDITAQWTNSDSTQPATSIMYDPIVDFIGLTGDLDEFNNSYGDGAIVLTFTFVPSL